MPFKYPSQYYHKDRRKLIILDALIFNIHINHGYQILIQSQEPSSSITIPSYTLKYKLMLRIRLLTNHKYNYHDSAERKFKIM